MQNLYIQDQIAGDQRSQILPNCMQYFYFLFSSVQEECCWVELLT